MTLKTRRRKRGPLVVVIRTGGSVKPNRFPGFELQMSPGKLLNEKRIKKADESLFD